MDRPVEITRSYAECKFCNDIADMCNEIPDCTHCENRKGTWIDTITSLLCLAQKRLSFWKMAKWRHIHLIDLKLSQRGRDNENH